MWKIILYCIILVFLGYLVYFSIMILKNKIAPAMIPTMVEDRMMNEVGYQVTKRGYDIKFYYEEKEDGDYTVKVRRTTVPKNKKKYLKYIALFHVILKPAWGFRKFDKEDDLLEEEDEFEEEEV